MIKIINFDNSPNGEIHISEPDFKPCDDAKAWFFYVKITGYLDLQGYKRTVITSTTKVSDFNNAYKFVESALKEISLEYFQNSIQWESLKSDLLNVEGFEQ